MATPMDLFDVDGDVMTYGGLADARTAWGGDDDAMHWCGAFATYVGKVTQVPPDAPRRSEVALTGRRDALVASGVR